jgi:hypothetical protein
MKSEELVYSLWHLAEKYLSSISSMISSVSSIDEMENRLQVSNKSLSTHMSKDDALSHHQMLNTKRKMVLIKEAIKCLETALEHASLPLHIAKTRVKLASLLLLYTDEHKAVEEHLGKAVIINNLFFVEHNSLGYSFL